MMKYSNYIILFILLTIGVILKDHIHISTNLLSLFASKEAIEKLSVADKLGYSKELIIVVKGLDEESKSKVKEISKKLLKINNISFVQTSLAPSREIKKYYKEYYSLLASFDNKEMNEEQINEHLQSMYNAQFTNVFYTSIDKNDPLKIFSLESASDLGLTHKGTNLTLGEYGYLIRVTTDVSASQMGMAKVLYNDVNELLQHYEDVVSFAPFYYTVENSKKIQEDVQWIVLLSTLVLLIIYYFFIKNIKLLAHTLIALFSSMLFAALISPLFFENFSILALAFGMSVTAVSIDYLLHYHFHNFYQKKYRIDKNVLYGYLTTIVAFGIFSFIPIPIISQISFFAVLSLSFAYFLFTFIFPHLTINGFVEKVDSKVLRKRVPSYLFFISSIALLAYSLMNIELDKNIKNLDYQNEKLLSIQNFISSSSKIKLQPVIVQADSKDTLINNLHTIKQKYPETFSFASFIPNRAECLEKKVVLESYDFDTLNKTINTQAKKIGFRDGYFKDAYKFAKKETSCDIPDLSIFESYKLFMFEDESVFYTMALVKDIQGMNEFDFVTMVSAKEILSNLAVQMYKDLSLYASIVIGSIFLLLLFSVKERILYALNYILFPISITLAILVSISPLNLMHLFSLIILIAIGIDYGIYMSNTQRPSNTMLAIKYSILSTFAAFGVLIFSSIVALNSIGIVISIGASAIFLLIKVMK
ncbi:hypothetical protein N9X61_03585 [Sulfurimonas sp.]|nr:hypothetical protein [Sulfurimonas sp.]